MPSRQKTSANISFCSQEKNKEDSGTETFTYIKKKFSTSTNTKSKSYFQLLLSAPIVTCIHLLLKPPSTVHLKPITKASAQVHFFFKPGLKKCFSKRHSGIKKNIQTFNAISCFQKHNVLINDS